MQKIGNVLRTWVGPGNHVLDGRPYRPM